MEISPAGLAAHPENLATEVLHHVLSTSLTAKNSLLRYIEGATVPFDESFHFGSQVQWEDQAVPNIVGINENNKSVLIIESKFWAGLPNHQPVNHIKKLPAGSRATLLFISPNDRLEPLWNELIRRCEGDYCVEQVNGLHPKIRAAKLGGLHFLVLVTWTSIINAMLQSTEERNDLQVSADLRQLLGLSELMDSETFQPLRSEELAPEIGKRIIQFIQIINEVTEKLANESVIDVSNSRAPGTDRYYSRSMTAGNFGLAIQLNYNNWSKLGETPLWLRVKSVEGTKWLNSPVVLERLSILREKVPPRLLQIDERTWVPLFLPLGVEKEAVVQNVVLQIKEICNLLLK